ncbi:hypothetical protein LTR17_026427 [Elasticomyces elasticus]|nr:hypothetical protein LTR17_026427 [Elasticomyces elasticus]
MAVRSLLALPEELVAAIATVVEVGDLLSFALACKECYRITRDRLNLNAAYHAQYRIQHDRLPLTIPALLQLALRGNDQTWHFRALDYWGTRTHWIEWKTYHWSGSGVNEAWLEPVEDHSHLDKTFFRDQEYEMFKHIMRDQLHFADSEVDHWLERTRYGHDESLKGMLIALSPHINRVNYIAHTYEDDDDTHPLTFFCRAITSIAETPGAFWPPGFLSLRKVSVCTTTTLQHPHDAFYADAREVAPLFRLPNIKVLNLSLLGYLDEDEPKWTLEPRSSSVEELGFYCCELDEAKICRLIGACRVLRRLMLDGGPLKEVTKLLATEYGDCMEEPMLNLSTAAMTYTDLVSKFKKLRLLHSPTVEDLLLDQSIEHGHRVSKGNKLRKLQDFLPRSIRTIRFVGSGRLQEVEMQDALMHAIADLVDDENYSALEEVCLFFAIEGIAEDKRGMFVRNAESVRRIVAKGVRLHYPTNGEKVMGRREHGKLHPDYWTGGNLTDIETDPTPLEKRYD